MGSEDRSRTSSSTTSRGETLVVMIKGFPGDTNEDQLRSFLIRCVKERNVKLGIGNVVIWQHCAYVKTTKQKGKCEWF